MNQVLEEPRSVPVVVHLSGARRGTTQRLRGDTFRIGTGRDVEIHVAHEPCVASEHATLRRLEGRYILQTQPDRPVWINGRPARRQILESGDVLEIGRDGPILRFRLYPPGSRAYKTPAEAFSDCIACARHGAQTRVGRAALFLTDTPRELATQTSKWFRAGMIFAMVALVVLVAILARSYIQLEDRLEQEELRVTGIRELLEESEGELSPEDLESVRSELSTTVERLQALEARTDAPVRVLAAASDSVVFLQGSYGFIEPDTQRPLRFAGIGPDGVDSVVFLQGSYGFIEPDTQRPLRFAGIGPDGLPLRGGDGSPIVGLGGSGPVLEAMFTGTAFVATEDGLLLTNKHVALPWVFDDAAKVVTSQGFLPVMRRFIGYLPATTEAFDVQLVVASDNADLAVLICSEPPGQVDPLPLQTQPSVAGDEILVLGYPTGIRALLARADEEFVNDLAAQGGMDFWVIAQRLAAANHIAPLASRGIVAQVTPAVVVYDAETTRGGSGGPVLDLEGRVIAVTSAIVPEFGGSNLGVPSSRVRAILTVASLRRALPARFR